MSEKSSVRYEQDAPSTEAVKRGMKQTGKAFLSNRKNKPARQAAIRAALRKAKAK